MADSGSRDMRVLADIAVLATCSRRLPPGDAGIVRDAAVAFRDGRIVWVGSVAELPAEMAEWPRESAGNGLVVPGLVDAHTHLCFGGWRADEFELRCRGTSYQEIARAGGGIMRTVAQTRACDEDTLVEQARARLAAMLDLGVTTVEAKSGYGLSLADELKILRVYERLRRETGARIVSTFLGAHVVPAEYRERRREYIDLVCNEMLPSVAEARLARFCDVFVEDGAYTADEARQILTAAEKCGMRAKLHVDQLGDSDGAALAAEVGAVSADHLEYSSADGMKAMVEAGVVPVTLPFASLYLRQRPMDGRKWIEAGAEVAVATDFNPGSAPSYHLPLAMTLACTMNGLTPIESLLGATRVAAKAIGEENEVGSIERGMAADALVLDAPDINHWLYHFRPNAVVGKYVGGKLVDAP